jgi:hypothetical protein
LKSRVPLSYTVCLIGGMILGMSFGHLVFPELEVSSREPFIHILFSLFGTFSAVAAYEMVALILRPD